MRKHLPRLLSFGIIGTLGFLVDTAVLYLFVYGAGTGLYVSRVFSYLAAATFTWWFNRILTFSSGGSSDRGKQWLRFLFFNLGGGIVNYGTYSALVATIPLVAQLPVLGVAAGSIAGMFVNYTLSSVFVFAPQISAEDSEHGS